MGIKKGFRAKLEACFGLAVTNDMMLEQIKTSCSLATIPGCTVSLQETMLCFSLEISVEAQELDTVVLNHTIRQAMRNLFGMAKLSTSAVCTSMTNGAFDALQGVLHDEIDQRLANGCLAVIFQLPDPDLVQQLLSWTVQRLQAAFARDEAGFNIEGVQNPTTGEGFVTVTAISPVVALEGVATLPLSKADYKAIASKSLSSRNSPCWSALHTLRGDDESGNLSLFFPPGMEWPTVEEVAAGPDVLDAVTNVPVWCTHPDCMLQSREQRHFDSLAAARAHFNLHHRLEVLQKESAALNLGLSAIQIQAQSPAVPMFDLSTAGKYKIHVTEGISKDGEIQWRLPERYSSVEHTGGKHFRATESPFLYHVQHTCTQCIRVHNFLFVF